MDGPCWTMSATARPTSGLSSRCERSVVMCTVSSATWRDAQHQYEASAVRALRRTALHAVAAMVATAATGRTRPRSTPRRRAAGRPRQRRRSGSSARPRWSRAGSSLVYTPAEVRALTPVRDRVEKRAPLPDLRDVFLCHAWDDRQGAAKELHVYSSHAVSGSGSARRTSPSARRCSVKSTGVWRSRESGSCW